jgi:DNA polymerase III subunit delta'
LNNNKILPWSLDQWQLFVGMRGRLPHAVLLHGRQGIGKLIFSRVMAEGLLCESPDSDGFACGSCPSCNWLAQDNHPDFRQVEPESRAEAEGEDTIEVASSSGKSKSRYITVDQIRALSGLLSLSTHRHGLRIVVIHPAETLNSNAANALLKMLEEPPPATLFVLVTHQLQRLLPTIRSRCHKIAMPMPSRSEAEAWLAARDVKNPALCLAQSGGAPLAALQAWIDGEAEGVESFISQLSQGEHIDPFTTAAHWGKADFGSAIAALQKWSHDLISARFSGSVRFHPARLLTLQEMGKSVDLRLLLDYQRKLVEVRAAAAHPLNAELQLEALLIRYAQLFQRHART